MLVNKSIQIKIDSYQIDIILHTRLKSVSSSKIFKHVGDVVRSILKSIQT